MESSNGEAIVGPSVTAEVLNRWIERDFPDDAIAAYGTSVERFQQILKTGKLPRSTVPGAYNYYATPFIQGIESVRPEVSAAINAHLNKMSPDAYNAMTSDERVIEESETYAEDSAILDYIYQSSGVLMSGEASEAFAEGKLPIEIRNLSIRQEVIDLEAKIGEDSYDELQKKVNNRHGLIIFYNQNFILNHEVIPNPEGDREIAVNSDEPVTIDAIAGVRFLSEAEREEALRFVQTNNKF